MYGSTPSPNYYEQRRLGCIIDCRVQFFSWKLYAVWQTFSNALSSVLEYDALAKVISQHPERQETLKWVSPCMLIIHLEQFSIGCCKTSTKVSTLANHKGYRKSSQNLKQIHEAGMQHWKTWASTICHTQKDGVTYCILVWWISRPQI